MSDISAPASIRVPLGAIDAKTVFQDQAVLFAGSRLFDQRQRKRGEVLAAYFDTLAGRWDRYRARNKYLHKVEKALFRTYISQGTAVLELGCATGDFLASVRPA